MRPTAGLVSRTGVYAGWPSINGSLGPMSRTVTDLAKMLDCMVAYDPEDPITSHGFGRSPASYADLLDAGALNGARIGILREPMGFHTEPDSEDFKKVTEVFDRAISDLTSAGAEIVDPIEIPDLNALLAKRANDVEAEEASFREYVSGSANAPFATRDEVPVVLKAGEMSLHHGLTFHGSGPNRSERSRPLLIHGLSAADSHSYTAMTWGNSHSGEMLRGRPARMSHHEPLRLRLPPDWSAGYSSIFDHQGADGSG